HGGAFGFYATLFRHKVNNRVGSTGVNLCTVSVFEATDVAGELYCCKLEPVAYSKEGYVVFSCIFDSGDFAFCSAWSKTVGNEYAIVVLELIYALWVLFELFSFKISNADFGFICSSTVTQSFTHAYISVS